MENHIHLKINMKCMLGIGMLPLKFENFIFTVLYWLYSQLTQIYIITFVFAQFVEVYRIAGQDVFEVTTNLGVSLLYAIAILKMFVCKSAEIMSLAEQIRNTETVILSYDNEDVKELYWRQVKWNYFVGKMTIWVGLFTLPEFYLNPFLLQLTKEDDVVNNSTFIGSSQNEEKPLPFSSWFPFDKYRYYYIAYTYDIIAGIIGASLTVSTDIFFVGMMTYAIGQIKILQYCLKNSKEMATKLSETHANLSYDKAVKFTISHCVAKHQTIIKYVSDLNKSMRLLMLFDFAIASMQIAMLGLQIIVTEIGWQQLFALEYLLSMLYQLSLFYWHANEISLESLAIASSIWESEWLDYKQDIKKSLLLVMMRSQRPLALYVGPFYKMSTETCLSILRMAYSYVAVLRQVYGNKL